MARIVVVVLVLLLGGFAAHETGWKIDEVHVRRHLERQLAILRAFDHDAVCADAADDYSMRVIQYADDRMVEDTVLDAAAACSQAREALRMMQDLHHRSRGRVNLDIHVDVRSVKVAPGGGQVTVDSVATMKMGQVLVARTRSTETLSRRFWRVRTHGGQSRTWMYVY